MKEYSYTLNTIAAWGSWDYGTVCANSEQQAIQLAKEEIKATIAKMNKALESINHQIDVDFDGLEVKEVVPVKKLKWNHAMSFNFTVLSKHPTQPSALEIRLGLKRALDLLEGDNGELIERTEVYDTFEEE
jgi:hypothetical protein